MPVKDKENFSYLLSDSSSCQLFEISQENIDTLRQISNQLTGSRECFLSFDEQEKAKFSSITFNMHGAKICRKSLCALISDAGKERQVWHHEGPAESPCYVENSAVSPNKNNGSYYIGANIISRTGEKIGSVCLFRNATESANTQNDDLFMRVVNQTATIMQLTQTSNELDLRVHTLEHLVYVDELTQLYNRRGLMNLLSDEIARTRRGDYIFSVCMLDGRWCGLPLIQ